MKRRLGSTEIQCYKRQREGARREKKYTRLDKGSNGWGDV